MDVVTTIHKKDICVADLCLKSVKQYCLDIRNMYYVSADKYLNSYNWINESMFPFNMDDVSRRLRHKKQTGWYWQQIMQFYLFDLLQLSDNILFINADVILLKELELVKDDRTIHNFNDKRHEPYFKFNKLMIGDFPQDVYGCCHYMVYNKYIMKRLKAEVEKKFNLPFWECFLYCIDQDDINGASEFELYFSYILKYYNDKIILKRLKYADKGDYWNANKYQAEGFDYVGFHAYMRGVK